MLTPPMSKDVQVFSGGFGAVGLATSTGAMATTNNTTVACKGPMKATSEGAWQGDDPLHYALPLIILQICLVVVVTRTLAFLLRPLRQPRVVAEIIVSFFYFFPSFHGPSS